MQAMMVVIPIKTTASAITNLLFLFRLGVQQEPKNVELFTYIYSTALPKSIISIVLCGCVSRLEGKRELSLVFYHESTYMDKNIIFTHSIVRFLDSPISIPIVQSSHPSNQSHHNSDHCPLTMECFPQG